MPRDFPESQVVRLWREALPGRTDLVTEDDGPVSIIYPGRPNDDRGADLRDAVIATSGGPVTGDIEFHVRSSSWCAHGHQRDPVYNRVVLHVVFWNDSSGTVYLQNGRRVPTLALQRFVAAPARPAKGPKVPGGWRSPCRGAGRRLGQGLLGELLDRSGDERFLAAAACYGGVVSSPEAGQAMYRGVLRALGYARNKHPMAELACRLPLASLEAALPPSLPDGTWLAACQAILIGTAGLLPSQRRPPRLPAGGLASGLEDIWAGQGEGAGMPGDAWQTFKVRPGNLPVRRLGAMGYLMLRFRRQGLTAGLMGLLEAFPEDSPRGLQSALLVPAGGPWTKELDFGVTAGDSAPALLGQGRAAEIVINVVLPFAAARGGGLAAKAAAFYQGYPRLAENTLERHMRLQTGIDRRLVNTARRQQGLLHIFKTLCSTGRCGECELAK